MAMDALQRIEKALEESGGESLWDYGFDPKRASKKSLWSWLLLTEAERLGVSRFNPSKMFRNEVINLLHRKRFNQHILHQLSSLSLSQIKRITAEK